MGFVANFAQEVMKEQLPLSGWGLSGQARELEVIPIYGILCLQYKEAPRMASLQARR